MMFDNTVKIIKEGLAYNKIVINNLHSDIDRRYGNIENDEAIVKEDYVKINNCNKEVSELEEAIKVLQKEVNNG